MLILPHARFSGVSRIRTSTTLAENRLEAEASDLRHPRLRFRPRASHRREGPGERPGRAPRWCLAGDESHHVDLERRGLAGEGAPRRQPHDLRLPEQRGLPLGRHPPFPRHLAPHRLLEPARHPFEQRGDDHDEPLLLQRPAPPHLRHLRDEQEGRGEEVRREGHGLRCGDEAHVPDDARVPSREDPLIP